MNIRKVYSLILTFLLLQLALTGQAQNTEKPGDSQTGFFWETSINHTTFLLLGSVHAGKAAYYPLPDLFEWCYENSETLIMEIEDDFDSLENKMLAYAEKDRLPEELYFRHHLDSASISKILEVLDREDFLKYDQYKGWFLNMTLIGSNLKLVGFDPEQGIDMYIRSKAAKDQKPVVGLDKFEDQLALFEFDLPHETQIKVLERTISTLDMQAKQGAPLLESYFTWNSDSFEKTFLSAYDFENPNMKRAYDHVFVARNQLWVEKLEKISQENPGTYMVVVGAGHFFGPSNIRELLEQKGYTINPLEDQETSR